VPAKFLACGEWLLQIDPCALRERAALCAEGSLANRFAGKIGAESRMAQIDNRQATAVDGDAV